jgi:hypothetical protein
MISSPGWSLHCHAGSTLSRSRGRVRLMGFTGQMLDGRRTRPSERLINSHNQPEEHHDSTSRCRLGLAGRTNGRTRSRQDPTRLLFLIPQFVRVR